MRDTFTLKLLDKNIRITALYDYIREYCHNYLTDSDSIDFEIVVNEGDIEYERKRSAAEDTKEGVPTRNFRDEYLETLAVYRKIAEKMLDYDTLHGSAVAGDGAAYLFTAKSGTGKSTHTRLWREYLGERAVMINDDKPLISLSESGIMVYGTPWDGKHRLSTNMGAPLKAICILERAEENSIEEITASAAYNMLVQQTYKPKGAAKLIKTLQLIDKLSENVKLYRLGCNMDIQAAEISYKKMSGRI